MAINLTSFLRQLTTLSLLLFAVYGVFALLMPGKYVPAWSWTIVPYFYLVVLLSKYLLYWLTGKKMNGLGVQFVSVNIVRFAIYVATLLTYAFVFPDDAVSFIVTFFVFYFFYTIYEVVFLYRELRTNRKNKP